VRGQRIFIATVALLVAVAVSFHMAGSIARASGLRSVLSDYERSTIELFERVSPAVVAITAVTAANDPSKFRIGTGSGFIWDEFGNIITNEHVIHGADTIEILLASGERRDADLVGVAPNYDLAVIRLKEKRLLPPAIAIGSSANLKV
jgi:S1-C subfamily serine protease